MIEDKLQLVSYDKKEWVFRTTWGNRGNSFIFDLSILRKEPNPKRIIVKDWRLRPRLKMSFNKFLKQPCLSSVALVAWDKFKKL